MAETVADRVDDELDVVILEDGGRGYVHTWLAYDGRHYDAECVEGVADHRDLPFFERHPEAAIHLEPESTDPAQVRHRGEAPLYPSFLSPDRSDWGPVDRRAFLKFVVAGIAAGLVLFLVGYAGQWAIRTQAVGWPSSIGVLMYDIELVGELLVIISPIVFYLILPAHLETLRRDRSG